MSLFEGDAHQFWMREGIPLTGLVDDITNADDIAEARKPFKSLSMHMISLAKAFDPFEEALSSIVQWPMISKAPIGSVLKTIS
jgi:hypothetical protein